MKVFLRLSTALLLSLLLLLPVAADEGGPNAPRIVTESLTDDLTGPLPDDPALTVAGPVDFSALKAKAYILMEQESGQILAAGHEDDPLPPASITKVMSLLLFMQALDSGKITREQEIVCSEHAASMGGSQIWLEPGERMTVDDLLKAVAVGSANDATVALAEAVAGSEENFVADMNATAQALGAVNTHFVNCSGLDGEGHLTTAKDVALMARALMAHQPITQYTTIWMDTLRNGATQLVNTNKLVRFYDGATGLKTGTTDAAGCCLAATAERNDLKLIAVVMGCPSSNDRFASAKALLNFGFANYEHLTVPFDLSETPTLPVTGGTVSDVLLKVPESLSLLAEKGGAKVSVAYHLPESVTAPVMAGEVLGQAEVRLGDEVVATAEIRAADEVPAMTLGAAVWRILQGLFHL